MKFNHTLNVFLILGVLNFNILSVFGQTPVIRSSTAKHPQWEYLVVGFREVYYSDPKVNAEINASASSKLFSLPKDQNLVVREGLSIQKYMDTLGKSGWELISIVETTSGFKEMVFKRLYDENRLKQEEELVKKEGERIRNIELTDLDKVEVRQNAERKIKAAIESIKDYPIFIESINTYPDLTVSVKVVADGTATLLKNGNKYRSSEATKLAKSIADSIVKAAGIWSIYDGDSSYLLGKIRISLDVVIIIDGEKKVVATTRIGGN